MHSCIAQTIRGLALRHRRDVSRCSRLPHRQQHPQPPRQLPAARRANTGRHVLRSAALAQPLLETLRLVDAVEPVERDADLRNKTILVTGATAGVGRPGHVQAAGGAGRARARLWPQRRTHEASRRSGWAAAVAIALDLCSLDSVRACAEKVKPLKLDVLVLNAGVNANVPTAKHPELDCSLVFGPLPARQPWPTTYWLRCCWTRLSADARVVCLASVMHHHSAACHAHDADYAESKLAMVLLARALSRGELGRRVDGVPVNPGAANSDIWRHIWAPFPTSVPGACVAPVFLTIDQALLRVPSPRRGVPLYLVRDDEVRARPSSTSAPY